MNRVLVTGATGFIGTHLVGALRAAGASVTALDLDVSRAGAPGDGVDWVRGDLFDGDCLARALRGADTVIHLVAKTHDFSAVEDEAEYHHINVIGTRRLLEACRPGSVRHVVYFSSVKAMTEASEGTLDETFPPRPTTAYGRTKLAAEEDVRQAGIAKGFRTTTLRLPMVYGPGNKGNVYRMIAAVDRGRFALIGRGENRRSMVYVKNVVEAALAVARRRDLPGDVYLVTDGTDYTVRELYEAIARGLGRRPLPFGIPLFAAGLLARIGDAGGRITGRTLPFNSGALAKLAGELRFSSERIRREAGFAPAHRLQEAIDETIRWYRSVAGGERRP
ncbi:MAG: NAD-dependent epimerase/dehydratase family protein [Desulfobacterales bacterium]|jgi:nucleoside-diphosphate-sugar epimerase|nr:NAD-dependent epimerase/dehydratase family protein [Desulfobacterales bacterium]